MITIITILLTTVISAIFLYLKIKFNYWKSRKVPTLTQQNLIFGDITRTVFKKENYCKTIQKAYLEFRKNGHKFGGLYLLHHPNILITDPEMVKLITVQDFDYFMDRGIYYDSVNNPISANMFTLDGDKWKFVRQKISPAFTSGKLKNMMGIIEEHVGVSCEVLKSKNGEDIAVFKLLERLGIDIIGHTAFGLNCNTLDGDSSQFHEMTANLFNPKFWTVLKTSLIDGLKNPASLIRIVTSDKTVEAFFINLVRETMDYREKNDIKANDFMQILIELRKGTEGLSVEQCTAEAYLFFLAAYETQSKTLNLCLYELARNKDLQNKLRREINEGLDKNKGMLDYDGVFDLKLLDMVIHETMRKHPSVLVVNRICTKEYRVPNSQVVIEKGLPLTIPIYAFHHDPDNFEEPDKFDPYRFSKENIENIKPYTYFPFGEGPRYCIGKRLAVLQMKIIIIRFLQHFEFSVSPKTKEPLRLDPVTRNLLLSYESTVWLNIKCIK